jgi:hypothetical protein
LNSDVVDMAILTYCLHKPRVKSSPVFSGRVELNCIKVAGDTKQAKIKRAWALGRGILPMRSHAKCKMNTIQAVYL